MGAGSDYKVGYKKPPKQTQFKKGRSGNPQGRPKGTRNLKSDLLEELNEKITIREGGRVVETTKQRGFVKSLVTDAIRSNGRAKGLLADLYLRLFGLDDVSEQGADQLTRDETEALALLEQRLVLLTGAGSSADEETTGHDKDVELESPQDKGDDK